MFGSRKSRPPHPPPLNSSTANPSAASAALSAFTGARRASTSSLSAAAAAAALRARPTTPTNVAEVQTKRTNRRSASVSSSLTGSTDRPHPLRRQSSSGSMSERTFRRSPSPGNNGGAYRRAEHNEMPPPPVPAIPESVNMAAARNRGGAKPKSLGLQTTPVRTASQKMASGAAKTPWFGAANVGDLGSVRTSDAILSTAGTHAAQPQPQSRRYSPTQGGDDGTPGSPGSSINFSYPARARVASPTAASFDEAERTRTPVEQPKPKKRSSTTPPQRGGSARASRSSSVASDQSLVYDPNSRRMIPRTDLLAAEQKFQAASEPRPKKKKPKPTGQGSHFSKGTVARSHGTAVDSGVASEVTLAAAASLNSHRGADEAQVDVVNETAPKEPQLAFTHQVIYSEAPEDSELTPESHVNVSASSASSAPEAVPAPHIRPVETREAVLRRMPSDVAEEEELSESGAEIQPRVSTPPNMAAALDAVPVRHSVYTHGVPSPPYSENMDDLNYETLRQHPVELATAMTSSPESTTSNQATGFVAEPREAQVVRRESRTHSNSPIRSARFGPVQETLTVKHEPPARSTSPRKSALKQSSPSRGASPTGEISDAGVESGAPVQRKKSVRVSFDDENTVVVGEAADSSDTESVVPSSPQQTATRKHWYNNLGLGKKKGAVPLEEDEFMKPRPTLPSFGSIRGRKVSPKPAEERPLVRPQEPIYEADEIPSPDVEKKSVSETPGQSSDHALGALIQQNAPNNGANISKVREPLPPVVTSAESYGYASDTASSDDESALLADTPRFEAEDSMMSQASTLVPDVHTQIKASEAEVAAEQRSVSTVAPETVPAISITHPSPLPDSDKHRDAFVHFPGEFPETETETDGENLPGDNTILQRQAAMEPVVQAADGPKVLQAPATISPGQTTMAESSEESEGNSIYSDAYEDLSDIEGDGFQSLDAVLESPMVVTPPRNVLERAQAHRDEEATPTQQVGHVEEAGLATPTQNVTQATDPWEAAKAYWRSLTTEKRAQLEKEAVEEAGADGDLEEVPDTKKPRRKKSVEKRTAEKKAIEQQRAAVDHGRTYMITPGTKVTEEYQTSPTAAQRPQQASTTNGKAESGGRLRKSMRGPAETPALDSTVRMRKSMRSGAPEKSAPRQRPASHQPLGNTSSVTTSGHTRTQSENTTIATKTRSSLIQPTLRRRGSDSSASSFKRARPASSSGFGFRKTLRTGPGPVDMQESGRDQQSSRFSIRSISPGRNTASPPVSMGTRMRTTLRGDASPRRGSDDSGKGYLRFSGSFGRSTEKKGKRRSRFGDDSSDDDEVAVPRFASRFDDSSDEDAVPAPLQPSSMPKTMRSSAKDQHIPSPPLPEEEEMSEEELGNVDGDQKGHPRVTNGSAMDPTLRRSRSGRALDSGRPLSRRSGLMSSVLRRNKMHDGSGKVSRPERMESAARRDTNLERSTNELAALRSSSYRGEGRPSSPKLQKKFGNSWPLGGDETSVGEGSKQQRPPPSPGKDAVLVHDDATAPPRSSSVVRNAKSQPTMGNRPQFLARRTMSNQSQPLSVDGTKKKKKFGALRRMFKIDD